MVQLHLKTPNTVLRHQSQCSCQNSPSLQIRRSSDGVRQLVARASSDAAEPSENLPRKRFFGRGKQEKEDAARRALEGMFKDQKDVLASFDTGDGSGGGSRGSRRKGLGGGGDGGGGQRGWQAPDWRDWSAAASRKLAGGSKAVLALCGFVAVFVAIPLLPRTLGLSLRLVKKVLGLDGGARSALRRSQQSAASAESLAGTADLGQYEASVIAKYGWDGVGSPAAALPLEAVHASEDEL